MIDKYPSDYQEIFDLIISLKKNTNQKELENYFYRLTKGSLGEFEFLKRIAFENIPIIKINTQSVLWKNYNFETTPDFIINYKNKLCAVEVKNYNKFHLNKFFKIEIKSLDSLLKFKKQFNLNKSLLGIKRFEKWYLLDAIEFKKKAIKNKENYIVPIEKIANDNLLKEEQYIFNLGSENNTGVFFKKLIKDIESNSKRLVVFVGNKISTKEINYLGNKKKIIKIMTSIINKNIKEIIYNAYNINDIKFYEDILPTKFSISNKIGIYKNNEIYKELNELINNKIIKNKNFDNDLKRIADINWYNYMKEFKKHNIEFKDMKQIINKVNTFKKILEN